MRNYLILLAGLLGSASSVFFIKDSLLGPATLAGARTILAAALLSPLAIAAIRRRGRGVGWDDLLATLPGAALLSVHYVTWFIGVRSTSAALSTLIVNLVPILMPFLIYLLLRERLTRGEVAGSAVAMVGVAILSVTKDGSGQSTGRGVAYCVFSICLCAGYLAMGRRFGRGRNIFAYIVPLYLVAGVLCTAMAVGRREALPVMTTSQILILLGAVIFPTVIGHTAMNHAMAHLPSQVVSISNLAQFAFVAVLAVPLRGEYPSLTLALPATLVLAGALIVIKTAPTTMQRTLDRAAAQPGAT